MMIELDVSNGVCTMDMWIYLRLNRSSFQLAGAVSGQAAFDKLARAAALCRGEKADNIKLEEVEGKELNVVEEGEEGISDKEGDIIDGEEEMAPRNKPTQKEREEHEAIHEPLRDWWTHCMMGRGRTHYHATKQLSEDQSRRPTIATDYYL